MFVEVFVVAQQQPQHEQFGTFFGQRGYEERLQRRTDERGGFTSTEERILHEGFDDHYGNTDEYTADNGFDKFFGGFGMRIFLPDVQTQQDGRQQGCCQNDERLDHRR